MNDDSSTPVTEEKLVFTVSFPDIDNINIFSDGKSQRLELEDFGYLMVPGKPMLPAKTFLLALPPGAKATNVDFILGSPTHLQDTYDISPVGPIVILDESNYNEQERMINEWENNYKETYSSDQAYPEKAGKMSGYGTFKKYSYVSISVCPFMYYPNSKQLFYYNNCFILPVTGIRAVENYDGEPHEHRPIPGTKSSPGKPGWFRSKEPGAGPGAV